MSPRRPRRPDWPERLAALIEARRAAPFAWGSHDCALFAAEAIAAVTGAQPFAHWRGRYANEAEAEALLAAAGGLEATVAAELARYGAPELPPACAQRGDVGLLRHGNTEALGVVLGATIAVPGPDRLAFVPARALRRAWAI